MTRIFTDGAEMRDTLFFDFPGSSYVSSTSPAPAYSSYYYKVANPAAYKFVSAISECYLRQRVCTQSPGDGGSFPIRFRDADYAIIWLTYDPTGRIKLVNPVGTLVTATDIDNADQWYLWEVYFKIADNPSGRFVLYRDGVKVIDYTGDTLMGSHTTFDNVVWEGRGGAAYIGIDDIALNDTNGGSDNSYCGDGVIIKVTPDGNGAHNNWHGSDSDDVDNYLLVDEYPKDDDTTYVYHDGSASGTQDQYTLSDYDGTNKTILRIYPEARIRKTSAAAHTVKLGTLASGGTDAMSAARNLTTVYARYVGNEQTINPVDSNPWEEADIDALQFVVEVG